MTIDKEPIINSNDRTIKVKNNIDTNEDTIITVNGLIAITEDDIENISDNIITISDNTGVDFDIDVIGVIYTSL